MMLRNIVCFFFFKQKTAYDMRISDWSSDVCSSDLAGRGAGLSLRHRRSQGAAVRLFAALDLFEIEFHGRRAPEDRYRHLDLGLVEIELDRKSTRLNSSH